MLYIGPLINAVFGFATAALFVYLASRLRSREVSGESRAAWTLFIVWWYGIAATTAITGLMNLLGGLGLAELLTFIALTNLNLVIVCIALWGLLYYLAYLFTGYRGLFVPLGVFYIGYYLFLTYYLTSRGPNGVEIGRWSTRISYEETLAGPLFEVVVLLLVGPHVVGGLAYFALLFKLRDPTQRYRVLMVSSSFIVWFGSALLASIANVSQQDWWQIASRVISVAAAGAVFLGYFPPAAFQRSFHVKSLDEEASLRVDPSSPS